MNTYTRTKGISLTTLLIMSLVLMPLLVSAQDLSAQTEVHTGSDDSANTSNSGDNSRGANAQTKVDDKLKSAIDKADKEIARRIQALTDLQSRVNAMQRVTANFKQTLTTNVTNQISGLTQLKDKIDADQDAATLKADIKSVGDTYRIFMLVLPQARIAAAADREVALISMMSQLGAKLQARVSAAQSAGSEVGTLLTALTDMSAKLTDASTQAQAAVSVSATLAAENGDQTIMAQNTTALKTARSDIAASKKDLEAARADAEKIIKGLKSLPTPTATSTTP